MPTNDAVAHEGASHREPSRHRRNADADHRFEAGQAPATDALTLYWIPLGADTRVVRWSGRVYEAVAAGLERRERCALYHAALIACVDGDEVTVEVAPVPDDGGRLLRGVVAEGSVGDARLGRWRLFRYEVRRWSGGIIPDLAHAVGGPVEVTTDPIRIRAVLDRLERVPALVWGRDELHVGDMWNSNSVVAWTLATSGIDTGELRPPPCGRAPGWQAGLRLAGHLEGERVDAPSRETHRVAVRIGPSDGATRDGATG